MVKPLGLIATIGYDIRCKAEWCYQSGDAKQRFKVLFTDGTAAMIVYRLMQWSRRWKLVPLELFFNKLNAVANHCIIGRGAEFGPGFVLIHCVGVVINGKVRGGSKIFIEHQVTIGAERQTSPEIGDDCFFGAGAKVIGGVKIGHGAKVGANAVVVEDVPDYCTVAGVPAKIVRRRSPPDAQIAASEERMPAEVEPGQRIEP